MFFLFNSDGGSDDLALILGITGGVVGLLILSGGAAFFIFKFKRPSSGPSPSMSPGAGIANPVYGANDKTEDLPALAMHEVIILKYNQLHTLKNK